MYAECASVDEVIDYVKRSTEGTMFEGEWAAYQNHRDVVSFVLSSYDELSALDSGLAGVLLSESVDSYLSTPYSGLSEFMDVVESSDVSIREVAMFARDVVRFRAVSVVEADMYESLDSERLFTEVSSCFSGDEVVDECQRVVDRFVTQSEAYGMADVSSLSDVDVLVELMDSTGEAYEGFVEMLVFEDEPSVGEFVVFEQVYGETVERVVCELVGRGKSELMHGVMVPSYSTKCVAVGNRAVDVGESFISYQPQLQFESVVFEEMPDVELCVSVDEALCDVESLQQFEDELC